MNKHSQHKEAAWAVIAYLVSQEGQLVLSCVGSPPTIKNEEAFEQYSAADMEATDKTYNIRPILSSVWRAFQIFPLMGR